jgi:hypothetical protein
MEFRFEVMICQHDLLPSLLIMPDQSTLPFVGFKTATKGFSFSSSRYAASASRVAGNV